jgi:mono/diheme cytochrome c family protein
MFALVVYLYSLTPPPATAPMNEHGALVFARECGRCHGARGYSGELVPLEEIGTHPELGGTEARGTGHYRPQSLIDVRDAAPYLHHGVVPSLADMLSSERLAPTYMRGTTPGPVAGHAYGLDLPPDERAALIAHLETL